MLQAKSSHFQHRTVDITTMNSKLYIPRVDEFIHRFETDTHKLRNGPEREFTSQIDLSSIQLASPVQATVERAKSELKQANQRPPLTIVRSPVHHISQLTKGKPVATNNADPVWGY